MKTVLFLAFLALAGPALADEMRAGEFIVRYNALSADGLPAASAKAQGVAHTPEQGLLNVSASRIANDDSVEATVKAKVTTLTGDNVPITIRKISEGGSTTYLGTFTVPNSGSLHFVLDVTPRGGTTQHAEFNQDFIVD
ncbi:DUF4426 domain-containing protein [Pinirhizobacter sp.]|jgi:hypothetical protein|uniref:DUF4426 domain-containing protein n=1 Tax=Pinirhizobacter sp. TaxID=2950432 RepID=UPI002F429856